MEQSNELSGDLKPEDMKTTKQNTWYREEWL